MDDTALDGNAAGGVLQEVFPFEMTMAEGTCANCGTTSELGAAIVYMSGMGSILHCHSCEQVLIRLASAGGSYWLDMRGMRTMRIRTAR
jgi:hypothetical protein